MASGNLLGYWLSTSSCGPATAYAQLDHITGASTPAELVPVLAYDSSTAEYADFRGKLPPHYAGGGVTLYITHGGGATSGAYNWRAAFRSLEDDAEDIDTTAHTYDFNDVDVTGPTAVGEVAIDTLAFTDGADMDNCGAGDEFIIRVGRNPADAQDTMAADAFLHSLELRET